MPIEAGDDLDCPFCDDAHAVRRSKSLRLKGFARRVDASLYVECPAAGYVAVTEDGEVEAASAAGGDDEREDWP